MNIDSFWQKNTTINDQAANSSEFRGFLRPHHRDWIYFNSQQALAYLEQMQCKGELMMEYQRWSLALPFFGKAREITEILLQLSNGNDTGLRKRLNRLTDMLKCCLIQNMGQTKNP